MHILQSLLRHGAENTHRANGFHENLRRSGTGKGEGSMRRGRNNAITMGRGPARVNRPIGGPPVGQNIGGHPRPAGDSVRSGAGRAHRMNPSTTPPPAPPVRAGGPVAEPVQVARAGPGYPVRAGGPGHPPAVAAARAPAGWSTTPADQRPAARAGPGHRTPPPRSGTPILFLFRSDPRGAGRAPRVDVVGPPRTTPPEVSHPSDVRQLARRFY